MDLYGSRAGYCLVRTKENIGSNEILAEKLYYTFTNYFEIAATQLKPCTEEIYFLNGRIVEVHYV